MSRGRRRAASTVRFCDACEPHFAPMTMTLTAILQNCMRILQLLLPRDMDARTPLPTLRTNLIRAFDEFGGLRIAVGRDFSRLLVCFSRFGRLSIGAVTGREDNEQPSPRASLASAYSRHSYKLKLVAQRTKYIEHIHIQPAARGAPTSKKFVPGNAAPTSPCCATATRVHPTNPQPHPARREHVSARL